MLLKMERDSPFMQIQLNKIKEYATCLLWTQLDSRYIAGE